MRTLRLLTVVVSLPLLASQALAWSDAGHKIVASIAFRQLTPAEQQKILAILEHHPRFQDDFTDRMPDEIADGEPKDKSEWLFQQAAVWPDLARGFPRGTKDKFHRPNWHFINLPIFLTPADRRALEGHLDVNVQLDPPDAANKDTLDLNVIQMIRLARKVLSKPDGNTSDKALMLSWLFHTVGDIHQPLHSSALFSRKLFPGGDHGGNLVHTEQRGKLHSFWDQLLGVKVNLTPARKKALTLLSDPEMKELGRQAATSLDEKTWLEESHKLAEDLAYDPNIVLAPLRVAERDGDIDELEPIDLAESYMQAAGDEAKRRVVQAGYRLGAILKAIAAQ